MIRFPLFGVPVRVAPTLWLLLAVVGWFLSGSLVPDWGALLIFMAAAFASLLTHEMGHALVGRRLAGGTPCISMYLGGSCRHSDVQLTRGQDILMTLAGPLSAVPAALLVVGVLALVQWQSPVETVEGILGMGVMDTPEGDASAWLYCFLAEYVIISCSWAVVNLLPVFPMDGGMVLCALLRKRGKAHVTGMCMAAAVALFAFIVGWWLLFLLSALLFLFNYACCNEGAE